jgi:hypothetical protein
VEEEELNACTFQPNKKQDQNILERSMKIDSRNNSYDNSQNKLTSSQILKANQAKLNDRNNQYMPLHTEGS